MQETEYKSNKARKPKKNHPWRNTAPLKVHDWAKEKSEIEKVNNFRIGQLDNKRK
jgi:hypothetical protein